MSYRATCLVEGCRWRSDLFRHEFLILAALEEHFESEHPVPVEPDDAP